MSLALIWLAEGKQRDDRNVQRRDANLRCVCLPPGCAHETGWPPMHPSFPHPKRRKKEGEKKKEMLVRKIESSRFKARFGQNAKRLQVRCCCVCGGVGGGRERFCNVFEFVFFCCPLLCCHFVCKSTLGLPTGSAFVMNT